MYILSDHYVTKRLWGWYKGYGNRVKPDKTIGQFYKVQHKNVL